MKIEFPSKTENFNSPGRKHPIRLPRTVLVGNNVLEEAPKILKEVDVSRVLVISGPTTWKIAGEDLFGILSSSGIQVKKFIAKEATKEEANKAIQRHNEASIGAVFGVGGGKNIDIAKVAAKEYDSPMISVPTALSNDGVASPFVSLKRREQKFSEYALSPLAVLVDLTKIVSAPKRLLRSGVGDMVSKINAVLDWKIAHRYQGEYYGGYAGSLSEMTSKIVMDSKEGLKDMKPEAIRTLSEAVVSSGIAMGIAGSSRPASGAEHLFSHALDSINENLALHGEQCGVGTILMLHHRGDKRWKKVREFLRTVRCPVTAEDLEIPKELIIDALVKAPTIRDRYTILDQKPLNQKKAEKLAVASGVLP